ncbi:inosine triphosphate pyrophosphatase [Plakobranchus ocellatus]|uniref:Inosine triphosphate pyrophosphatase n=1 Tax=Plakobranchus ocellatus TaxID=259542 RepID=A0AAV4ABH2_9GAST|nr:inosine triphosphate pyrophosphatase [Plakobranchus ocellatus]
MVGKGSRKIKLFVPLQFRFYKSGLDAIICYKTKQRCDCRCHQLCVAEALAPLVRPFITYSINGGSVGTLQYFLLEKPVEKTWTNSMARRLVLVTGNKNKLKEFLQIAGEDFPYKVEIQDFDLPEYQGEPEEIIRAKCELAREQVNGPVIVEDVSLCFNALGGMPGPYIKWFLKSVGPAGG